jgi:YVTN family beta-propeller protein
MNHWNQIVMISFKKKTWPSCCHIVLTFIALTLLGSCQPSVNSASQPTADPKRDGNDTARLSLFLNLKEPAGPGIRLEITNIEVLAENIWLPITEGPLVLDSEEIAAKQFFVGGRWVPPGLYERLRFTLSKGSALKGQGKYEAVSFDPFIVELAFPSPFLLSKNDSQSLFLTWDVQESQVGADSLLPALTIALSLKQLIADLIYVACPDIDTIFIIRTDKNWVADSFGIKGRPTHLAIDPDPSRQRLYVFASRDSTIKVVNISSQRIVDTFYIPNVGVSAFMTVNPDARLAYVFDERNNNLNRLDLLTGNLLTRLRLGYRPQYATYLSDSNLLAVSSALSQFISVHDPINLTQVKNIACNSPDGLLAMNNQLYIAESGANSVSIYDFASNRIQSRLAVGYTPRRLLYNGNKIYVSNYGSGSLSVILPGQLGVSREILGLGQPLEMAFNQNNRWLYVGDDQKGGLAVIDTSTDQLIKYINLGAQPAGMAVIQ